MKYGKATTQTDTQEHIMHRKLMWFTCYPPISQLLRHFQFLAIDSRHLHPILTLGILESWNLGILCRGRGRIFPLNLFLFSPPFIPVNSFPISALCSARKPPLNYASQEPHKRIEKEDPETLWRDIDHSCHQLRIFAP